MRFLLTDMKTYTFNEFNPKNGKISLKNTDKIIKKEEIKEFIYVAEDEKELKELIMNWEDTSEVVEVAEIIETEEVKPKKVTKSKKKNG